jgi:DNA-directed RNA polymerase subunit M/transcription elongation factor TFIIS
MLNLPTIGPRIRDDPKQLESLETFEAEQDSAFGAWRSTYEDEIRRAKTVLQEATNIDLGTVGPTTEFLKCRKCKGTAIDVEQKQTRSADEPMTVFCMCRTCGTRFVMK